jgi:hypothetical protein
VQNDLLVISGLLNQGKCYQCAFSLPLVSLHSTSPFAFLNSSADLIGKRSQQDFWQKGIEDTACTPPQDGEKKTTRLATRSTLR